MTTNCVTFITRKFHSSNICCSIKQLSQIEGIKPIEMSYLVHEEKVRHQTPLIVMHGLFGSKNNWNSLSRAMNKLTGRKVIAVDARNHGESPHSNQFSYYHLASDINYLLKSLAIPKACILGHSMGGRAAMLYAHIYPETINKLIVVDISHRSPGHQMTVMDKYFKAMKSVMLSPDLTMSLARKQASDQLATTIPEPEIRQFLLTNLLKTNGAFKWRLNINVLENAFRSEINNFPSIDTIFTKPALFIGGRKSSYLREEDHADLLKMFPQATFEYLDAGHWVHAERPNEFLSLVQHFLKE